MSYTVRKKKCSSLCWYKAIIVWFSQFNMTVVQNEATLSEKRRPGTGSSPKTAGSQSVKFVFEFVFKFVFNCFKLFKIV